MNKITLRKDMQTVSRGTRNTIRRLGAWLNTGQKETTKKRLLIIVAVPAFLISIGSPAVAITLTLIAFLVCVFWNAGIEEQQMTIAPSDFLRPFQIGDEVMDFDGLLAYITRAQEGITPAETAEEVASVYGGPRLTPESMEKQLQRLNLLPSPTRAGSPQNSEGADHNGATEGHPEEGRGKAERLKVGFTSLKKRYDAFSDKKEKTSEERPPVPEDPDHDRMGPPVRSGQGEGDPRDHQASDSAPGREPDVHGGEGEGDEDPGRVPSPPRRDAEVPAQAPTGTHHQL